MRLSTIHEGYNLECKVIKYGILYQCRKQIRQMMFVPIIKGVMLYKQFIRNTYRLCVAHLEVRCSHPCRNATGALTFRHRNLAFKF
jgi:hypothetical protein